MHEPQLSERARDLLSRIQRAGSTRTDELSAAVGYCERDVDQALEAPKRAGLLITCDVVLGGGHRVTQYRLSAIGGGRIWEVPYGKTARAPDPVKARLQEWGRSSNESATGQASEAARPGSTATRAIKAPAAPAADQSKKEKSMTGTERLTAAFTKHGPMTFGEIKKYVDVPGLSTYLNTGSNAKPQRFAKLGGSARRVIWGLPTQKLEDRKEAEAADTPPASIHRRAPAKKSAGGGVRCNAA